MSFGAPLQQAILQVLCKSQALPAVPALWCSLHTDDPVFTGAHELVGNGYARLGVMPDPALADGNWTLDAGGPAGQGRMRNVGSLIFAPASAPWPAVSYAGLWSDPTSTLASAFVVGVPLATPVVIGAGNSVEILPLALEVWLQ